MTDASRPVLPRTLGMVSVAGMLVGIMVGSGIFRTPASVARLVPDPTLFLLIWVVGGCLALSGALVFGELAGMFPATGGRYVFLREGVGPRTAFVYAWSATFLLRPVSHGAVALVFAAYLGQLVPVVASHEKLAAAALIAVLAATSYRSVRISAGLTTVASVAKVLALLGILITMLLSTGAPAAAPEAPVSWHGFGLALVTVMWTYSGWGSTTYITGEVRDAERTMPLVLTAGVTFVMLLFLAMNWAILRALPLDAIAASPAIGADAAGAVLGEGGRRAIAFVVVLATFGSLNAVSLTGPRLPFAMGADIPRLAPLAKVHASFATPHVAVVITAMLSITFLWLNSFEQLADTYILGSWPFYVLCTVGLFRLRRLRPDHPRPYRVPLYPVVPLLFLVAATLMLLNAAAADPIKALMGTGVYLIAIPIHMALTRPVGGRASG